VHFVGLYCTIILQGTAQKQKTNNLPLTARLANTTLPVNAVSSRKALSSRREDRKITTGLSIKA
jgi:hypothetical protein